MSSVYALFAPSISGKPTFFNTLVSYHYLSKGFTLALERAVDDLAVLLAPALPLPASEQLIFA